MDGYGLGVMGANGEQVGFKAAEGTLREAVLGVWDGGDS